MNFTKKYDLQNIHRIDRRRMAGWWLKIRRQGKSLDRYFWDHQYFENAEVALIAAIDERDRTLGENPKSAYRQHTSSNNITGINGVSFVSSHSELGAFSASWPMPDGRTKNRKFGVKKYGFHGALAKAIEARKEWEQHIQEQVVPKPRSSFLPKEMEIE